MFIDPIPADPKALCKLSGRQEPVELWVALLEQFDDTVCDRVNGLGR
jgi:hypothetical protein